MNRAAPARSPARPQPRPPAHYSLSSLVTMPTRTHWSSALHTNRPCRSGDQSNELTGWLDSSLRASCCRLPATPSSLPSWSCSGQVHPHGGRATKPESVGQLAAALATLRELGRALLTARPAPAPRPSAGAPHPSLHPLPRLDAPLVRVAVLEQRDAAVARVRREHVAVLGQVRRAPHRRALGELLGGLGKALWRREGGGSDAGACHGVLTLLTLSCRVRPLGGVHGTDCCCRRHCPARPWRRRPHLLGVLRARVKHVQLRLQACGRKLVHLDVGPVKLHAAHAVADVGLPSDLRAWHGAGRRTTGQASLSAEKRLRRHHDGPVQADDAAAAAAAAAAATRGLRSRISLARRAGWCLLLLVQPLQLAGHTLFTRRSNILMSPLS